MSKSQSRFPHKQKRLKCNVPRTYQCGGKCQITKNRCKSETLGMVTSGMEWLRAVEERKIRIGEINTKREGRTKYAIDDRGNVHRAITIKTHIQNKNEVNLKLKTEHQKNLYGIAMGKKDNRSPSRIKSTDRAMMDAFRRENLGIAKIKELQSEGLSLEESVGIGSWLCGLYGEINKEIYNPSNSSVGEGAGVRAAQGLRKLPAYRESGIKATLSEMGYPTDYINKVGDLARIVTIPKKQTQSFLSYYQKALSKPEFKEPVFFATSALLSGSPFLPNTSNESPDVIRVKYVITPKKDGTGQGRMLDRFTTLPPEFEVLYPPYSRFKMLGIDKKDDQITIRMKEA